jgi:15-cis-phytoene synthase
MSFVSQLDASMVNRAAAPGSMRYFACLYAPEEVRDVMLALYVIDAEIRESAHSANHDVAHTRLGWWRAEIDRLINANAQHPATKILSEQSFVPHATFARLHELLVAADMDLARMTYSNEKELLAYCSRSGGTVESLIACALTRTATPPPDVQTFANSIGVGIRKAEIVRDLRQDAYDGRVYMPLEELQHHSVETEHLRNREIAPAVREVLKNFQAHAKQNLTATVDGSHRAALRPLFVIAALHRRLLDRIAAKNFDVTTERVELGPIEKPWTAWRAARNAS